MSMCVVCCVLCVCVCVCMCVCYLVSLADQCTRSCFGNIQSNPSFHSFGCIGTESTLVNCSYNSNKGCGKAAGVYCGKYDYLQQSLSHLIDSNFLIVFYYKITIPKKTILKVM